MDKPVVVIQQAQAQDEQQLEAQMALTWAAYQEADRKRGERGIEFGRACYQLRASTKAQGARDGKGFEAALGRIGASKPTAYRWIARYEESAGLRITRDEVKSGRTLQECEQAIENAVNLLEEARQAAETAFSLTMPDFTNGITGVSGEVEITISPSVDHHGFFWMSCWNGGDETVSELRRPIRKDAVHFALSQFWVELGPAAPKPNHFAWTAIAA